ncbi:MAG: hypothetical protein ABI592_02235 [Acidobacteriota bacterium]
MSPAPTRALVRPPGESYPLALTRIEPPPGVDLDLARSQHAGYVAALERLGVQILELPPDDALPDAVFVQDPVCVLDGRAIVGRAAMAARGGEAEALVSALAPLFPVIRLEAPAALDWGDVLVADGALFAGLSARTNAAALAQLRNLAGSARTVEGVPVPEGLLHLLTGCSYLGERTVLAVSELEGFFRARGYRVLPVAPGEAGSANVLTVGRDVVAPAGYPETAERMEEAGWRVQEVPIGEFEKRDGGVTCLSILF